MFTRVEEMKLFAVHIMQDKTAMRETNEFRRELSKEKTNLMPLILLFYSSLIQCSTCFGR